MEETRAARAKGRNGAAMDESGPRRSKLTGGRHLHGVAGGAVRPSKRGLWTSDTHVCLLSRGQIITKHDFAARR